MRNLILTASLITLATTATTSVLAKEVKTPVAQSATCDYQFGIMTTQKDGRQDYQIKCLVESDKGYKAFVYTIGKTQETKMVASGKNRLVYDQASSELRDGKKVIFVFPSTAVRTATTFGKTNVLFTAKKPTLANFASYFNKFAICAQ